MATSLKGKRSSKAKTKELPSQEDSSESEIETEPAKAFHRRISTNKEIKTSVGHRKMLNFYDRLGILSELSLTNFSTSQYH